MRQPGGNPQLFLVLRRQDLAHPLTVSRGALADVDRHVKYLALRDAHQLALWLRQLIMQATQDVAGGLGVIVLHKIDIEPGRFMEGAPVETLEEEAPVVAEHFRFDEQHIGNPGRRSLHQNTFSLSTLIRYWP